ncbi:MAG: TPM domain-containing protein, partial [bacterium]
MKKIIIILLLFFACPALAYYNPGVPSGFVNDYSGTLTIEQKQTLENKITQFSQETSNEISVVLISSLKEDTIENFAIKLFEDWKIGKKGKDNGVLVLVAKDDRQMRIEVGYGLEGALTDAQSNWIINQVMKPAFKNNDFYGGLDKAVDQVMTATKGEYVPSENQTTTKAKSFLGNFDPEFIFYIIIFGFMWLASVLARSKSWWAGGVIGAVIGIALIFIFSWFIGLIAALILTPLGLLFDYVVSKQYKAGKASGI